MTRWRGLDILFIYVASCFLTFSLSHFSLPPSLALACTGGCVLLTVAAARNAHLLKTGEAGDKLANIKFVSVAVMLYYLPIAVVGVQDLAAGSVTVAVGCAGLVPFFLIAGGAVYALHVPNRWVVCNENVSEGIWKVCKVQLFLMKLRGGLLGVLAPFWEC